ncbi:hypothetical protein OZX74_06670 [Bifidobacterium sp. ESL0798]|uniref:hypothetical protein n=1 Tax=Bifidobacterium sp. ESL0798 TaxID=2983235 RepID=UPI0023F9918D|nr:hypothetical protein [Bifidobacterium sp. ESL0798]WEV73594.1 hypothetical protein OZX74_06670 [Bifidobacterium sp. ESL0798]
MGFTEIGLVDIENSLNAVVVKLPDKFTSFEGDSSADGYNEFKRQPKDVNDMCKKYESLLAADVEVLKSAVRQLQHGDEAISASFAGR